MLLHAMRISAIYFAHPEVRLVVADEVSDLNIATYTYPIL